MGVTVGHNVCLHECQLSVFLGLSVFEKRVNVKKREEKNLDRNPKLRTVSLDNVMLEGSALGIWGTSVSA